MQYFILIIYETLSLYSSYHWSKQFLNWKYCPKFYLGFPEYFGAKNAYFGPRAKIVQFGHKLTSPLRSACKSASE